jgi:hypothetical protein
MNHQSAAPHFFDIPLELFRLILGLLDDPDLLSIALTCKQFKDAAIDKIWAEVYWFPDMLLLFPDDVWDRELMVRRCKQSASLLLTYILFCDAIRYSNVLLSTTSVTVSSSTAIRSGT